MSNQTPVRIASTRRIAQLWYDDAMFYMPELVDEIAPAKTDYSIAAFVMAEDGEKSTFESLAAMGVSLVEYC